MRALSPPEKRHPQFNQAGEHHISRFCFFLLNPQFANYFPPYGFNLPYAFYTLSLSLSLTSPTWPETVRTKSNSQHQQLILKLKLFFLELNKTVLKL